MKMQQKAVDEHWEISMHLVVQGFVAWAAWKGGGAEWLVSDFSLPNRLERALVEKLFGCPVPRCRA